MTAAVADEFTQTRPDEPEIPPRKPDIEVTVNLHQMAENAIDVLAGDPEIFQRDKVLVHVVRATEPTKAVGTRMAAGNAAIVTSPHPWILERLSVRANWYRVQVDKKTGDISWVPMTPPPLVAQIVASRAQWPASIRPLVGITEIPIIRRDGSVLDQPGYDDQTGYAYIPGSVNVAVPDRPTHSDAVLASVRLLDLVVDFPFESGSAKSAWLAALLTTMARAAIDGPVPAFIFDASTAGSGKSLLVELISLMVLGRPAPMMSQARDNEETEKRIVALIASGAPLAMIDNVHRVIDDASLAAALTSTDYGGRVLGETRTISARNTTVWIITGNNVEVSDELARRALVSRLTPQMESPASRDPNKFKYHPIREHVLAHRADYVRDALTILRAYMLAADDDLSPPRPTVLPLGSFEAWSSVVASAIVWLGMSDPTETSRFLAANADPKANDRADLLAQLGLYCRNATNGAGMTTTGELLRELYPAGKPPPGEQAKQDGWQSLRDAIEALVTMRGPAPSASSVGQLFRKLQGKWIAGRCLVATPARANKTAYRVDEMTAQAELAVGSGEQDAHTQTNSEVKGG